MSEAHHDNVLISGNARGFNHQFRFHMLHLHLGSEFGNDCHAKRCRRGGFSFG